MTKKQWDLFCSAISIAKTLSSSRIEDLEAKGHDAAMYKEWREKAEQARQELVAI